jgi:hypothetical protein
LSIGGWLSTCSQFRPGSKIRLISEVRGNPGVLRYEGLKPARALALLYACALLAACGGNGGGEREQPAPAPPPPNPQAAQSWSVTLADHPTDTCFKPGATIGLVVNAINSSGAPIANPAYTVSASPADGLETNGQGVMTVRGEGALELTVTYTGDRTANSTVTPQTFQLIRDGTAPVITITSPARGAIRQTAVNDEAVAVAGNVTDALSAVKVVLVDDDALAVGGTNLSENVAVSRPARWGTNILHVRAADACGNTAHHAQGFLQSDTYLAPAVSKSIAARVPGASTMRIAQVAFDDTNLADFDDLASVASRFLQTNMTAFMNPTIAQIPTQSFDVLSCTFSADPIAGATIAAGTPTLNVALRNGGFALTYVMRDVRIPVTYRQLCTGPFGGVIIDASATFGHTVGNLTSVITVTPQIVNRELTTSLSINTNVSGLAVDSSSNPVLAAAINAALSLFSLVDALLLNVIDSLLADHADDFVETALTELTKPVPIHVPAPINKTLNVAADWSSIGVTPAAMSLQLGQYIFPSTVGTPHANALGAINRKLAARNLEALAGPLRYGLNDDAGNQMLWALWHGGGLELRNLQTYAAGLPEIAVDLAGVTLNLSGMLPPVLMPTEQPSEVILSIADVRVTGSVDLDQNAALPGSGIVSFDVFAGLLTDGRTGFDIASNLLDLRLGDLGSQFYLQANSLQLDGNPLTGEAARALEEYLRNVVRAVMRQLARDISARIQLPRLQIDFPAQLFGTNSGLVLDIVSLRRDQDRFVVSVDPDDAYAPPVANIGNWSQLGQVAINAARQEAAAWLEGAELGCWINRSSASGWAIRDNSHEVSDAVKQALLQAGAPEDVARRWNRIFKSAWLGWGDRLTIPGLEWFPEFAADALSGVPHTSDASTGPLSSLVSGGQSAMSRASLLLALEVALDDYLDQPGARAAIEAFATDIASRFDAQLQTGTLDGVTGRAVYPDFALFVVVAGVLLYLEEFSDLIELWPPPPPRGALIGLCLAGGTLGGNAFD